MTRSVSPLLGRTARRLLGATVPLALAATAAEAQLRDGFRSTLAPRGDDTVTPFANFGFAINLRDGTYTSASACMNGYLTLAVPFDPGACLYPGQTSALATLPQFADVFGTAVVGAYRDLDSGPAASGRLGYGAGAVNGRQAFGFTWDGVFSFNTITGNFFQLLFVTRGNEFAAGDFDLHYNYGALAAAGGVAGVSDDGGFSGAAYTAAVAPAPDSRTVQCFRGGSVLADAALCAAQQTAVIPEPATVVLTLTGLGVLAGLGAARRRSVA